jgi:hypothetical protein
MHTKFWLGSVMGRDQLEGLGVHGRIILKGCEGVDWIHIV